MYKNSVIIRNNEKCPIQLIIKVYKVKHQIFTFKKHEISKCLDFMQKKKKQSLIIKIVAGNFVVD